MTELSRTSALASRHSALGSGLEDWNGMGTAWSYNSDPNDEHDAVREAAALFDMSPLKKVYVRGPDALATVNYTMTRDLEKVSAGQSVYGAVLNESGLVSDDAIAANNGNNEWLYCHGSGMSMERLQESAEGKNVDIELDDDLHNIAVQGPKSLALLNRLSSVELDQLEYFHHLPAAIAGQQVMVSRTGYSGERGYEIFCPGAAAGSIWDALLEAGQGDGVMPASFTALDKVRIEAGLLFYGYDMTEEHTPWEVGLGFTISESKTEFRGKESVLALKGAERFTQAGIIVDHSDAMAGGEELLLDGEKVGLINSPCWSHRLNLSLALAHIQPEANTTGQRLEVKGDGVTTTATVAGLPFYDQQKSRTHA